MTKAHHTTHSVLGANSYMSNVLYDLFFIVISAFDCLKY